jgi:hypothetical protein
VALAPAVAAWRDCFWVLSHFPITLSIVAPGAATVSLIGHAHDASAPEVAAWLLAVLLLGALSALWAFAVLRFLSADAWGGGPATVAGATLQGDELVLSKAAESNELVAKRL